MPERSQIPAGKVTDDAGALRPEWRAYLQRIGGGAARLLKRAALLDVEGQELTGGVTVTSKDLGTVTTGTLTLDMGDRPQQHYINGGAHTLAPGNVVGSCLLDVTNNSGAGAVTTSGWTHVVGDFTEMDGDKFRCHCSVGSAGSLLIIQEMQ